MWAGIGSSKTSYEQESIDIIDVLPIFKVHDIKFSKKLYLQVVILKLAENCGKIFFKRVIQNSRISDFMQTSRAGRKLFVL